jgi:hypothetical protein
MSKLAIEKHLRALEERLQALEAGAVRQGGYDRCRDDAAGSSS